MAKFIYICSAAHSGSTLLDLLLGSHSQIESLGEISFLGQDLAVNNRCTCGSPVRACHVWRAVAERLSVRLDLDIMARPRALPVGYPYVPSGDHAGAVDWKNEARAHFLCRKLVLGLYYSRLRFGAGFLDPLLRSLETTFTANLLTYEAARHVLNADMVVDSSKFYLKALGVYLRNPQEVRIILLTRDGRGVLGSVSSAIGRVTGAWWRGGVCTNARCRYSSTMLTRRICCGSSTKTWRAIRRASCRASVPFCGWNSNPGCSISRPSLTTRSTATTCASCAPRRYGSIPSGATACRHKTWNISSDAPAA